MSRGKGTTMTMYCKPCQEEGKAIAVYVTRYNRAKAASAGKPAFLEKKKFCPVCQKHQVHKSKEVKKAGTKALANAK